MPAAAPWLKLSEALDFLTAVRPQEAFATHDAVLSDEGKAVVTAWFAHASEAIGTTLRT